MFENFFQFLLALVTFDWLKGRQEAKDADEQVLASIWMQAVPWEECYICHGPMWWDLRGKPVWRHVEKQSHEPISVWLKNERDRAAEEEMNHAEERQSDSWFNQKYGRRT